MNIDVRFVVDHEIDRYLRPILNAFGRVQGPQDVERDRRITELDLRIGAFDGGEVVGSTASYSLRMTVPGGAAVETAGLTRVAVLPTHRRKGLLNRMMRMYFDEAHRRGQILGSLHASEGEIYGRYGFGMAAFQGDMTLPRRGSAFVPASAPEPEARVRYVDEDTAAALFAPIWDRARAVSPGMASRSDSWWRVRRLADYPTMHAGSGALERVVLEMDGAPRGYALYRKSIATDHYLLKGTLHVEEAVADSPAATRALWRWLFDIDLVDTITCNVLPADHPLVFLLADPRQMRMTMADSLWVRLIDVPAALSQRRYRPGPALVFEVADAFCPWNAGRYLLDNGAASRTERAPDISLDISALSSVYLGGFSFTQLALAGRAAEHTEGALRHGDALFRGDRDPWSPEIY